MNNIYLQIIQVWLYIHEALKTNQKGYGMAGKPKTVSDSLDMMQINNEFDIMA